MSQQLITTDFEKGVSLPQKRSRPKPDFENSYAIEKHLSDESRRWLLIHDETNWKDIELVQEYMKKKMVDGKWNTTMQKVFWKLAGTEEPKNYCGNFVYDGCFNVKFHPMGKPYIHARKLSCFRGQCEKCWLEKWLARESTRASKRIENYVALAQRNGFRNKKPIHVIVSPPWNQKYDRFDLLKEKCRKLMKEAGIIGGLLIYHPFRLDKETNVWVKHPHFHVIGFGWVVNTASINDKEGWVIKNKGVRDSLHATIYYQLSHAGISEKIHSVTWFGTLGYRSKYASEIKVEKEELDDQCPFCGKPLVRAGYVGLDRPPPDFEFMALLRSDDWSALESIEEALERKNKFKKKEKFETAGTIGRNWIDNDCRLASENTNRLGLFVSEGRLLIIGTLCQIYFQNLHN